MPARKYYIFGDFDASLPATQTWLTGICVNVRMLKQHGKTVFCDLCEDILEFAWVKETIEICDKVICCSTKLEQKVKEINPNTVVIEDAFEC